LQICIRQEAESESVNNTTGLTPEIEQMTVQEFSENELKAIKEHKEYHEQMLKYLAKKEKRESCSLPKKTSFVNFFSRTKNNKACTNC
jgi:nicotinic acid phosphoribosyltransferase